MKRLLLMLLFGATMFAQETVSRVLQLKYIHPDSTSAVLNVLSANKVRWASDTNLRVIALNGPADLVDAIEAAVKKLDVSAPATKNIEVTFQMLLAAPQGEQPVLPQDLTGVAQQLRNVFSLKSIRLLETSVIRGREGRGGDTNGIMAAPGKVDTYASYSIGYKNTLVSASDKLTHVRIDNLRFTARIPVVVPGGAFQNYDASVITDVDIREGQKVVVGKSSVDSGSQSIFLVVTAKVVD
jgi:type II secretory pathway component GspD/PulD (secretin)